MKIKGLIAILICMVMLIGIIPLSVFADDCDHANAVFYEATSPTCFEPGCIAYWYCEDCYSFLDENKQYFIGFKIFSLINPVCKWVGLQVLMVLDSWLKKKLLMNLVLIQ